MAMQAHVPASEICVICGRQKKEGIHIRNQLICHSCQQKIVETDVTDWKYQHFVNRLSKLQTKIRRPAAKTK
ncbi:MAG: sigma factor G inhibitor Gin [Sporolactobacillus sp.]